MIRLLTRRLFLRLGVAGGLGIASEGCGTLLYPDRIGQPPGRLDWGVVLLDGIGLVLFLVPGVIAFAVDFMNRTIYLPGGYGGYYGDAPPRDPKQPLVAVTVPGKKLERSEIEQAVSKHLGQNVQLVAGEYRTQELANLDEFWKIRDVLAKRAA